MPGQANNNTVPVDYDLTCWYLNARRVIELVGVDSVAPNLKGISTICEIDDQLRKIYVRAALKDAITTWLHENNPPTLGQLLITDTLRPNLIFTHYSHYYCKGLSKAELASKDGSSIPMAEAYSKLDEFRDGMKVSFRFSPEHLTSDSSWTELSGQRRLLILGMATQITDQTIEAIPWVIADPLADLFKAKTLVGAHWPTRLEVFIDDIDNFELVRGTGRSSSATDLEVLRETPEKAIKNAFAEIIGEAMVPKDWGGEKSDLFTSWLKLGAKRISTAPAFKGPAKFHPMTGADLGKNGDQIGRLFSEPADLLILQHCNEITPGVRDMMRAYAQQMGNLRLFCLIDGYDTLRILGAYGKCGVRAPMKS